MEQGPQKECLICIVPLIYPSCPPLTSSCGMWGQGCLGDVKSHRPETRSRPMYCDVLVGVLAWKLRSGGRVDVSLVKWLWFQFRGWSFWWRSTLPICELVKILHLWSSFIRFSQGKQADVDRYPACSLWLFINSEMLQTGNFEVCCLRTLPTVLIPPKEAWMTALASQGKKKDSVLPEVVQSKSSGSSDVR